MQRPGGDDSGISGTRSPLATLSGEGRLALSPWNEALTAQLSSPLAFTPSKTSWKLGKSQRTPVTTPIPKTTPSWARRVQRDNTPHKNPLNLFRPSTTSNLKAAWLHNLPNATQAEYWLRKSRACCENGHLEEAISTLKDALRRGVRPATEISRELEQLEKQNNAAKTVIGSEVEQGQENGEKENVPEVTTITTTDSEGSHATQPDSQPLAGLPRSANAEPARTTSDALPQEQLPQGDQCPKKQPDLATPPRDENQTEDHVTPGLSAMHNNMLFDTSPSPVLDLKQEYTPLSKRPPASHCPSPLRLGDPQSTAADAQPEPHLSSNVAAQGDETLSAGTATADFTPPPPVERPSESSRLAASESPRLATSQSSRLTASQQSAESASRSSSASASNTSGDLEASGSAESLEEAIANSEPMPLKEIAMATPKSAVRMTSRFAMDAAMLGSPATRFTPSRARVGKNELRAILEASGKASAGEQGSFATLSPMRTPAHLRATLGPSQIAVTPVRRSARKTTAASTTPSSLLQRSGYSFVPNAALETRFGKDAVIGSAEALQAFREAEADDAIRGIERLNLND